MHIFHTMEVEDVHLATCFDYKEHYESTKSVVEDMIVIIPFWHNTTALPDLIGLMLGYNQGNEYIDFVIEMMDCGTGIHSTLK